MKFTVGYWVNKEGVSSSDICQIREVKVRDNEVYLYTVPYTNDARALGGPIQEVYISSPQPDIIRVKSYHYRGSNAKKPEFELNDLNCKLEVSEKENVLTVKSGETKLVITKRPISFTFYYKDRKLTSIGDRYGHAMISSLDTPEGNFMRCQLDLDIKEKVYGLGERFTPFVKNGQVVDIWNEDGGTCSEIAYKNIPFYITNRGYGVFVNSSDAVSYEICSEVVTRVQFSVPGEMIDFMVIGGENMKDVLNNYTNLTGKPALPPAWSFGLWLTSSFTTSYDEKTVMSFVNGMKDRKIPLHVFHFDCFWMKENEWCNFEWDPDTFPDPEGMLKRMKEESGLKICVWINPYIGQKSPLFDEGKENGYLLLRPNGDVWQWDMWQSGMGLVDFTNPSAREWYKSKLRHLLDQGVDYFKTDFGERIPVNVKYFDGSDPVMMHNYYTYLYNKCVFEVLEEYKGKNEACLFARSATVGSQKFPVHWGGDCTSNYPSMNESLRGGLSLCMSGFGFWSHDISGFEGTATADVYKRWAAFGLLSTHSRLHGSGSYRVPWLFDEESVDVVRYFTELKCSLMPYIYTASAYANKTGVPVMRAMVLEFEKDRACDSLESQYMLGDSLLVAPIFSDDGNADYYIPNGKWTHFLSNKKYEGGAWIQENYDYFSLPLLARENSIIPVGNNNQLPEYDYTDGVTFHIFELSGEANASVVSSKGEKALEIFAAKNARNVTLRFEGKGKNVKVLLRNIEKISNLKGADAEAHEFGVLLTVNESLNDVTFEL